MVELPKISYNGISGAGFSCDWTTVEYPSFNVIGTGTSDSELSRVEINLLIIGIQSNCELIPGPNVHIIKNLHAVLVIACLPAASVAALRFPCLAI